MVTIHFEHIKTVQHNLGNGSTEPKLAMTDDNTPVIVKTFNGPEGSLILFNELFCYRLAILLDLKMPVSGVCLIDQHTTIYNNCINPDQFGYGFYSTYLNKAATLVETIIPLIKNKEDFYRLLLFDHVIFNPDRNPGNLLVQYYKNDITLQVIDHSHVFINQAIWDANCLKRAIQEKDYFSTKVLEDNEYLYRMFFQILPVRKEKFTDIVSLFRDKIMEDTLHNIITDIPKLWLPDQTNIDALIEYILYRVNHLDDICATIINFIQK